MLRRLFDLFNTICCKTKQFALCDRGAKEKKRFASLRFCVSSLHRDHANLLCIVKRLFNARAETRAINNALFEYIKNKTLYTTERVIGFGTGIIHQKSSIKEKVY